MKLTICETCASPLQFEASACRRCGAPVGFIPGSMELSALLPRFGGSVSPKGRPDELWHPCANAKAAGCNWLVEVASAEALCVACRLNRNVDDLSEPGFAEKWRAIETAKRRLIYGLMRLGLPIASKSDGETRGLAFDFRASTEEEQVFTGHADGLITVNIAEACSAERERQRLALGEPYRTLLGHMRHEAGHYYWDLLVDDGGRLEESRAMFGDERASYGEAIKHYYANGPLPGWEESHVTAYATMHPWEDFAETWTHYLHIIDTLDTGATFGLTLNPIIVADPTLSALATRIAFDPYDARDMSEIMEAWTPLTEAVNALNRSMGQPDLYPFELTPAVIVKLGFIHDLVHPGRRDQARAAPGATHPGRVPAA